MVLLFARVFPNLKTGGPVYPMARLEKEYVAGSFFRPKLKATEVNFSTTNRVHFIFVFIPYTVNFK